MDETAYGDNDADIKERKRALSDAECDVLAAFSLLESREETVQQQTEKP